MRATNILILVCILVTLYSWTLDPASVDHYLAFSLTNLQGGRVWTLVTAIFVHASLLHLLGNMVFLYVFGNTLESVTNSSRNMLAAFFLGGILSFPLSLPFFPPGSTFVGASAAIFTLTAVVMLMKPLRWSWLLLMPVGLVAILYFLYNGLAVYYQQQSDVAYVSHVIGFSLGLPLGIAWSTQWKRNLLISIGLLMVYFVLLYLVTQYILPSL
ncbi:MAG: rhomboid family intramembrane serine protease [Candidatus Bathyarchaeia archaeon]